jgi:PhzF family phenazine biosynthesis protein
MGHLVYEVNAFTANGKHGNPAGVVPDAAGLSTEEMQTIAQRADFAETAFVVGDPAKTPEVRFMTRNRHELALCGHATIATWSLLHQTMGEHLPPGSYKQQTKAGLLGITILDSGLVCMEQTAAQFGETIPPAVLAPLLGVPEDVFHPKLVPQIVSTGIADVLVPLKDSATLARLQPDKPNIIRFSEQHGISALHVFGLLQGQESVAAARNFSPVYAIDEEPATGTSNGAMLSYLKARKVLDDRDLYRVEQGEAMGELSYIYGQFTEGAIWIGGAAALVNELEV